MLINRFLWCFLHACGDVSFEGYATIGNKVFSPRMWRCFSGRRWDYMKAEVFSTHVEMFLLWTDTWTDRHRFLHACGDVSYNLMRRQHQELFSPRMWRCFYYLNSRLDRRDVFSTHVEMFPPSDSVRTQRSGFLHACGDVSVLHTPDLHIRRFSPRMWRCFQLCSDCVWGWDVFSTHVEMFLPMRSSQARCSGFLHACGDVLMDWPISICKSISKGTSPER